MTLDLYRHFREGGWGMAPILCWLIVILCLAAERAWVLRAAAVDATRLLASVRRAMVAGDPMYAVQICERHDAPVSRLIRACLLRAGDPRAHVRAMITESRLREIPQLERRTVLLPVFANLGVLTGLLGTITGLGASFGCGGCYGGGGGPSIDPGRKAQLLAGGISEAMNCTAFGLLVAIVGIASYALLSARTQRLIAEFDLAAASTSMLIDDGHRFEPDLRGAYRVAVDVPRG